MNSIKDPGHIDAYITPYYNAVGPQISVGQFSAGLASTNEAQFVKTIGEMKKKWADLNFVELYVASIRLYDLGYRKESVYWFYSAQYRGRVFGALLDEGKMGQMGDPAFELFQANNAFQQLAGTYINGYAFGDLDYLGTVIKKVKKEGEMIPDMTRLYPKISFKDKSAWANQNKSINDGLGELGDMLTQQKDQIKAQRKQTGVEAQFGKLASKDFPEGH